MMRPIELIKPYFYEQRYTILVGTACLITVDILQLWIPRIVKQAVDGITAVQISTGQLFNYAVQILAIALLIGLFRYLWRRCLLGTSRRVEEGLRNKLFSHIQSLSPAYFDRTKTGDLMAHATNDIQQVRMATGMGLVAFNDAVVLGAAAIGFMVYINLKLTLFVLIPMPLIVFGTRFFSRKMHQRYQSVQAAFADLMEVFRERFAGIRLIKAHNWQPIEAARVEETSGRFVQENLRLVSVTGAFFPMIVFLTNLSLAIVLYVGGRQTILGTITAGDFVAFISYLGLITWPMMAMGWVTNLIQRGRASLDRLNSILQVQPEISDPPQPNALPRATGELRLEQVTFSYNAAQTRPMLSKVSIHLPAGSTTGLVGPPGSGKTTLLNLMPRLYDVSGGRILLDGLDIRSLRLDDLRAQIAFVPQEPFLFAGTIRDNITMGRPDVSESEMIAAAQKAALHHTVEQFRKGYDTVVGEKGVILSGGQKQRVALARALLQPRPILILDDPISQVDMETGQRIIDTIRQLEGTQTLLIVTHRISAVTFADQIITLENGVVTESGPHSELVESGGYYARSFQLQELEAHHYAV
jgi:ATP-binding cassette subfamily B protein